MILKNRLYLCGGLLAVLTFPYAANAAPTISSPYVSKGETEIEVKGEYKFEDEHESGDSWGVETKLEYGVTDYWKTEVGVEVEDEGNDEDAEATKLIFENKFQLAPKGALIVDPGLKLEYAHSLQGGADEIEAELLLAKTIGQFSHGAEIGIAHEVGDGSDDDAEYSFNYGVKYNFEEEMAIGVEWYSNFGDFDSDFDEQEHKVGPVVYGEAFEAIEYQAGVLVGVSDEAPDATLKLVLGYEF